MGIGKIKEIKNYVEFFGPNRETKVGSSLIYSTLPIPFLGLGELGIIPILAVGLPAFTLYIYGKNKARREHWNVLPGLVEMK